MCDKYFNNMTPKPIWRDLSDFKLAIKGSSGSSIPYLGYIVGEVSIPHIDHEPALVPILIVPTTTYSS